MYRFTADVAESYPELFGRQFAIEQLSEIYMGIIDREEYGSFGDWLCDMQRCDLIQAI